MQNRAEQAFRDGAASINANEPLHPDAPPESLSHAMLTFPFRQYVIEKIKDPIRSALEAGKSFVEVMESVKRSMSRLPKGKLTHPTTLIIKEKTDKLLSYHHNPCREKMVEAGAKLAVSEYEHDDYYAFLLDYIVIELAIEVMKGNYKPRRLKFPVPACWSGPDLPDAATIKKMVKEYTK